MAGRKHSEKELRWREILNRQAYSGVGVREFCRREGISEPSFYAWRKKLGLRKDHKARTQTAPRRDDQSDNGRLFVPVQVRETVATLEILHPLGYRIQVTGDVDPVALRRVIETLDERGTR